MELWLPYGSTEVPVRIPDDNFYRIVEPTRPAPKETVGLVQEALENPVDGKTLKGMIKPGITAGIIVDSIVPAGVRADAVKVLSSHLSILGVERTRVFVRKRLSSVVVLQDGARALDPSQNSFIEIGKTREGTSVDLDPEVLSCEVKISLGMSMPHFASGLAGGPDSIIPASSSTRSITKNRALGTKGLSMPLSTSDNPVLLDSLEACRLAGPFYSLCFLPDGLGGVDSVYAGGMESVFRETASHYARLHAPKIERKLDIVIVSVGSLLGADLYHAVRAVSNVLGALKKGGTVILVAECFKGVGDPVFLDYARRFRERRELAAELRYRFKLGGHVNLFLQDMLERCRIQLVSVLPELFVREVFDLKPSQTASEAVQKAIRVEGKESKILIVPRGEFTVPVMEALD